jgi:hypothetical protein
MTSLLNTLAAVVHAENVHWWRDPATGEPIARNDGELLMLTVSELAEAMEGERKNLMDDHLPHRRMAEVEIADALIRVLDYAGARKISLYPSLPGSTLNEMARNAHYDPVLDNKGDGTTSRRHASRLAASDGNADRRRTVATGG